MPSKVFYGSPRQARLEAKETLPAKLDLILNELHLRDRVKDETELRGELSKFIQRRSSGWTPATETAFGSAFRKGKNAGKGKGKGKDKG